jgi:hypothetical protein
MPFPLHEGLLAAIRDKVAALPEDNLQGVLQH